MDEDNGIRASLDWLDNQAREGVWQAGVIKETLVGRPGSALNERIDRVKEISLDPETKAAVYGLVTEAIAWRGMALRVEAALHRQIKDHEAAMQRVRRDHNPRES